MFQVALQQCRNCVVQRGAPVCRLSACNPEYDHELSFADQRDARGDRGSLACFHRRDGLVCLLAAGIGADSYPSRRITFVVPYPAGGATDVSARLLANKLSEAWKQTVVVENKSGGGGVVGNDFVAKAQPDGYTVLVAITQIIQAPSLVSKLPYDVFKDLAPVTQVALSTIVLVVPERSRSSPSRNWSILPRPIPAKPYGTFGNATTSHLYGELLKKNANIDMTHVPYRGSAPLHERFARQHGDRGVSST